MRILLLLLTGAAFGVIGTPGSASLFKKKPPPVAPEPAPEDTETIFRAQIFLDEKKFGPGKIDGALGEFTRKAVFYYNHCQGIEPHNWHPVLSESAQEIPNVFTTYTIGALDVNFVDDLPDTPQEQAERKYMYYRSLREFVAERYHTDERCLARINPGKNIYGLRVGDSVTVPNVTPFRIEAVKTHQSFDPDPVLSAHRIRIDTRDKLALISSGDQLLAAFPITPGSARYIPYGDWEIKTMVTTPVFRYDKKMLQEGVRGDEYYNLPPGPNSPVGILWAGLNKSGIGLHGTSTPETIGRSESAGCIRLANWDAVRLSEIVRPGTAVEVK